MPTFDFDHSPLTAIWELTRACDLRCAHCRAEAQPTAAPGELTTQQGLDLLDQIAELEPAVLVLTGGDPLKRADLFTLIGAAKRRGIPVAVTPSGTPLLTRNALLRMRDLGVKGIALSLDGPDAAAHDAFRRQAGSFDFTLAGIRHARALDLPVQINTTATRHNRASLGRIAEVVAELGASTWSVFFLIAVGRGRGLEPLTAEEAEEIFAFLHDLSGRVPFVVRTTAAPHYRRFVLQRRRDERRAGQTPPPPRLPSLFGLGEKERRGVTDGRGFVFISHTGDVYPSGFLPLAAGNVCRERLADIYRTSPLFRRLRDETALLGKCGVCEFRMVCGGSRARAYAATGDPMSEDPGCAYLPARRDEAAGEALA